MTVSIGYDYCGRCLQDTLHTDFVVEEDHDSALVETTCSECGRTRTYEEWDRYADEWEDDE